MINITQDISIADDEIKKYFIRSPGPGGQNVNKVSTGVQLRFDARSSPAISPYIMNRLRMLAGGRMTKNGILITTSHRSRSQESNRRDALEKLIRLIREAGIVPETRRPTLPSKASKERRLKSKKRISETKKNRNSIKFSL